jgi:hypothetical protein
LTATADCIFCGTLNCCHVVAASTVSNKPQAVTAAAVQPRFQSAKSNHCATVLYQRDQTGSIATTGGLATGISSSLLKRASPINRRRQVAQSARWRSNCACACTLSARHRYQSLRMVQPARRPVSNAVGDDAGSLCRIHQPDCVVRVPLLFRRILEVLRLRARRQATYANLISHCLNVLVVKACAPVCPCMVRMRSARKVQISNVKFKACVQPTCLLLRPTTCAHPLRSALPEPDIPPLRPGAARNCAAKSLQSSF